MEANTYIVSVSAVFFCFARSVNAQGSNVGRGPDVANGCPDSMS